ncbi:N-acetylmuramoyl-L-alanine amidase [Flavobacterium ardleyense]|uniref:N-acetylmuramoyl-L-alanine amidase n=1 Tax=Flavobacterium ardleyense TaxID=2038737 RepID=A0ABW5Z9V6_9FLAO
MFLFVSSTNFAQNNSKFKVVLDAGHGGKDPGTTRGSIKEKDIVLDVVLRLGKILEKNKDITVVYTRKTDVFIELRERANIANKAKANLFISVHCNGVANKAAKGTETFVMGMSRTDTNLDIAKKENGVIFLEDNYSEKYKGFDPNNPETLLGLRILQEEFLGQSIELASEIEKNFITKNSRSSRGVKQQPIWVLDATVMPGVLIELGFVSHQEEGNYISSDGGKQEMAKSISDAIVSYKDNFFSTSGSNSSINSEATKEVEPAKTASKNSKKTTSKTFYKVQLEAGSRKIETKPANFKGLKNVSFKKENNLYKYYYGNESTYESCKKLLEEAKSKGYKTAYIVTFGKK